MTAQDRKYMVDVDDPNLSAFLAWHRDAAQRGLFQDMTWYSQLKMAFMAGRTAPDEAELPPSRDVLPPAPPKPDLDELVATSRQRRMAAGLPADPSPPRDWPIQGAPQPEFVHRATITGRIGPVPEPAMQQLQHLPRQPKPVDWSQHPRFDHEPYVVDAKVPEQPDPFARVRLTGPQQVAMDSLYPLPNSPTTWSGTPVRIEAPETRPMRVVPADFELVDSVGVDNLPIGGPVEDV